MQDLIITDRFEAAQILRSQQRGGSVQHVLSIGDPGQDPPQGFDEHVARKLYLQFHDIDRVPTGPWAGLFVAPTRADAESILRFGGGIEGGLLIHCQAGISRSTAAAVLVLAALMGPGRELDAARMVKRVRPQAWPNRLLVGFGDELLGSEGRLIDAVVRSCYQQL